MFESPIVETQLSQYLGSDTSSALIENSDPVIEAHELQESNLSMNIKHVSILEILQSLPGTRENSHVVFHHANSSSFKC